MADNSSNLQNIESNTWVEVSSNTIAHIGGTYDSSNNIFIPIKQYDSWVFDYSLKRWVAPVDYPDEEKIYHWNEESKTWILDEAATMMDVIMQEINNSSVNYEDPAYQWKALFDTNG
jgi:hypothetical protein